MTLEDETAELVKKETWIQLTAREIQENRGIDLETAVAASRWASLWIDDFNILYPDPPPLSEKEVTDLLRKAKIISLDRAVGLEFYPMGMPSLHSMVAVEDAFCIAYGDERIRQLF